MDSAPPTAATDQPATSAEPARLCARKGCSNPALKGPTGRPRTYCSRSCRSKVDRAKAKARDEAAQAAGAAAPDPTAAPTGAAADPAAAPPSAAPAAAVGADDVLARWGEDGRHLLGIAEAMRRRLTRFLEETATGDPAAAFAELAKVLPGYGTRAYMAAQGLRDKARWPHLDEHERLMARSRERIDRWDHDEDPDDAVPEETNAPRGETPTPAPEPEPDTGPVPVQRSAAAVADQARREACTDPEIRFDFPDLLDDLEVTFGPGWELGSWLVPEAQGVLQLRLDSTPIGWTAPLPDGPWGQAGWIACLYQQGGRLLIDTLSRPRTLPTADLALDAILRAHQTGAASAR
ncbi:hypothetical protein [Kitasatospora sp. NPDC008115]|uniref:hypothetical protein n=1 Tax=Kitasatospora sp. NPDC008115 TaxID=3364022 RepID=UPI0036EE9F33